MKQEILLLCMFLSGFVSGIIIGMEIIKAKYSENKPEKEMMK